MIHHYLQYEELRKKRLMDFQEVSKYISPIYSSNSHFFRAKFNLYFHSPFRITNTNLGATETQVLSSAAAMLHEDPSCCRGSTVIDRVILRNFRDDSEFERISRGCHFVNSSVTNVSVFTSFSPK